MGLHYHLKCEKCNKDSVEIEFCASGFYVVKTSPDDYKLLEKDWVEFLAKHSGHRIKLLDAFNKETDPSKINGAYILGIK